MAFSAALGNFIANHLNITSFTTCFEILWCCGGAYALLHWLSRDRQRPLDLMFCLLYTMIVLAWYVDARVILITLSLLLPAAGALWVVFHRRTLQRALIASNSVEDMAVADDAWIDTIISWSLQAMHRNISFVWFLEQHDSLAGALVPTGMLHADLTPQLMELFFAGMTHQPLMVWCNRRGKVLAVQPRSSIIIEDYLLAPECARLPIWQQHALIMSTKLDLMALYSDHASRLFTLIIQGKTYEQLSSHHVVTILKQYCAADTRAHKEVSWHHVSYRVFAQQQSVRSGQDTSDTPPGS